MRESREIHPMTAAEVAALIAQQDFSRCRVTVVGYGNMGRQYVAALRTLGVRNIRVCSRSVAPLADLRGVDGIEVVAGGFSTLDIHPSIGELGIIATPTPQLIPAACHLISLGFRKLLIEKPIAFVSSQIAEFAKHCELKTVDVLSAFNRVAYPAFIEAKARTFREGGIRSCTYTFTEFIHKIDTKLFSSEELARWGVANSLHVMSMAHGFIGMPVSWKGHHSGSLAWHPSGSIFVGSGFSECGIPFSYHADWGSTGRWSVEIHTASASYRLCPLERLLTKTDPLADWVEVPLATFSADVKTGFVEQISALLSPQVREVIPLVGIQQTVALTRFGEAVFGYS